MPPAMVSLLIRVAIVLLPALSKDLTAFLTTNLIPTLKEKAKATDSKVDDLFVELLETIVVGLSAELKSVDIKAIPTPHK